MNLDKVNKWLLLVANIGVLFGIVLLAYELRQNSLAVEAQTRSSIAGDTADALWRQIEHDGLSVALRKLVRGEQLDADEDWLLARHAHITFRRWENIYYQYRVGLYDEEEFAAQAANWKRLAHASLLRPYWADMRDAYSTDFVELVDGFFQ